MEAMRTSLFAAALVPVVVACSSSSSDSGGAGGAGGDGSSGTFSFTPDGCGYTLEFAEGRGSDFAKDDGSVGADAAPKRVRIGLGGGTQLGAPGYADPSTTAAIAWDTDVDTKGTKVRYGTSAASLDKTTAGFSYVLPGSVPMRVHQAHLCGGTAGATYYYQAGGGPEGQETWGPVQSFTFSPAAGAADTVTVGVEGDSRDSLDVVWPLVQGRMKDAAPTFQIFTGDSIPLALDSSENDYAKWLDGAWKTSPSSPGGDLSLGNQPLYAIGGNHENLQAQWLANFAFPGKGDRQGMYFSFDAGSMHVIVLDDNAVSAQLEGKFPGAQADILAFLEADLAAADERRATVPWVVVAHHRGELSTSNHGDDSDVVRMRGLLMPIWDAHHVTLVLNGHDHNYERSKPATWSGTAPVVASDASQGTTYVVCAGSGAGAYSTGDGSQPWSDTRVKFGDGTPYVGVYGLLTATATKLSWQAYGLKASGSKVADDDPIDTMEWTK